MNWSHALLVIAIISVGGAIVSSGIASNAYFSVDKMYANGWKVLFIIIATLSGALAAGLWR